MAFNNFARSQGLIQANGPDIVYTMRNFAVKMNNPVLPFEVNGSGKFYKHLFVDSVVNSWKIVTQEIQTVTAKISGNAQIDGTLLIGGAITIDGTNSRISSTSDTIDFDANNLTTTGNISAGNVQVTGGINTVGLTVTGSSLFGGNANFSGNLNALRINADTLLVNGAGMMHALLLTDGVRIQPFAGAATGGIVRYNTLGTLKRLDFSPDTNAVLTGGGTFKNLGSMVAPYTGWQWQGSDLVSTANDVYVPNSLYVGKSISIGPFKIKNGGTRDTIRTAAALAVVSDAQKIEMAADTVTMREYTRVGSDTSKYAPPVTGKIALEVAGSATVTGDVAIKGNILTGTISTNDLTTNSTISSPKIITSRITSPDSVIQFGDSSIYINNGLNSISTDKGIMPVLNGGTLFIQIQNPTVIPMGWQGNNTVLNPYQGNVGIGTSAPQAKFDVKGTALFSDKVGIGTTNPKAQLDVNGHIELVDHLIFDGTSTHGVINWPQGRNLYFRTNSTPGDVTVFSTRMIITGDGNVGIGIPSPDAEFHLAGGNNTPTLLIKPNYMYGGDVSQIQFADPDGGTGTMNIQYKDDGSPDLTILGGNVGIGTTNPAYELDVCGTVRAKKFRVATGWCDFVYEPWYKRMTFEEQAKYYWKEHHLFGVPPGAQIETEGADVGEILRGLGMNLEEARLDAVDLYFLWKKSEEEKMEMKKKLDELEERVNKLENKK